MLFLIMKRIKAIGTGLKKKPSRLQFVEKEIDKDLRNLISRILMNP